MRPSRLPSPSLGRICSLAANSRLKNWQTLLTSATIGVKRLRNHLPDALKWRVIKSDKVELNMTPQENTFAPIALFTFKRPEHTKRVLESLSKNPEFVDSPLFIYCDGARNDAELVQVEETRSLIHSWTHPNKVVIERDRNWGLANSVITGVTDLCERFGRVIVVEDDLVVSPVFLNFLNAALNRYADEPKVMQVSGYMFPTITVQTEANILPITSTWGWATWNRAWKHFGIANNEVEKLLKDSIKMRAFDLDGSYPYIRRLKQQLEGKTDSWGIQWYLSVFNLEGLVVYPPVTLVQNIGHDGSGTHCKAESVQDNAISIVNAMTVTFSENICVSQSSYDEVKKHLRAENRILLRTWAWLRTELKNRLKKII